MCGKMTTTIRLVNMLTVNVYRIFFPVVRTTFYFSNYILSCIYNNKQIDVNQSPFLLLKYQDCDEKWK